MTLGMPERPPGAGGRRGGVVGGGAQDGCRECRRVAARGGRAAGVSGRANKRERGRD